MKPVVFLGPTLPIADARRELDADFLPPVAQGDVYRALERRPSVIAIVDGYFDRVPSVWHKEILWALTQGVHVFGAASMGALRAVELAPFGMIGVGHIFRAFHQGELEDDDEVAVAHASAEHDYKPLSDAMVNIRATIGAARAADAINHLTAARLILLAKTLPYPDRSFRRLVAEAERDDINASEVGSFRRFLEHGVVDQKRADAMMLLRAVDAFLATGPPRHRPQFRFEHTDAWENARLRLVAPSEQNVAVPGSEFSDVLEEVRILGVWERVRMGALARALALEGPGAPQRAGDEAVRRTAEEYRREFGLLDAAQWTSWRADHGLNDDLLLDQFFADEATFRMIAMAWASDIEAHVTDYLRSTGELPTFTHRAAHKREILRERGLASPTLAQVDLTEAAVWHWYFETVLKRAMPPDRERYARRSGFEDSQSLLRALLRERCFEQAKREVSAATGLRGPA